MERKQIKEDTVVNIVEEFGGEIEDRLRQKGYGSFSSTHEILGVITEEYSELVEAVKSNKMADVTCELYDIAVACIFAISCIDEEALDW